MKTIISVLTVFIGSCCMAGIPEYLPRDTQYDPKITSPAEFLGFSIGERHLAHAEMVAYMKQLARESDRIQVVEIGRTHGHRPQIQLVISSPANMENLEAIRVKHLSLMDPKQSRRMDLDSLPVVMNLNYGVHGNEPSGPNATPVVAYYLAAAQGKDIEKILSSMVIVLDPSLNPDGMDRFASWTNNHSGRNPSMDPNSLEHNESWPNGRTNYYWFDLNRDWLLLTQPESIARMKQFNRWMPDLLLDFHEMGTNSTYFFQPGVLERNNPLTPQANYDLTLKVSKYFAEALDTIGSLYFSQERFDDFYMGKGSTMPDLKGSVGILFEQASSRGIIQDSVNGPVTFPFTIQNQVTISLSCLKAARELHTDLLENKRTFFMESLEEAKSAGFSGYRFTASGDPARALEFVKVLKGHDIIVEEYANEEAWFIPLEQPHYRYLESMVEQRTAFKENIFYDITAWTLPLAYNLDLEKVKTVPDTGTSSAVVPDLEKSSLGYLVDWAGMNAPRVLLDLLQEGIIVKVAKLPLSMEGVNFGYGTLFVPVNLQEDKSDRIHEILESGMRNFHVSVFPVKTFLTEKGIDLGSRDFIRIKTPDILLVAGRGMSTTATGTVWHLMDQLQDYPITLVDPQQLKRMDLSHYTALVIASSWTGILTDSAILRIKEWIKEGGTLICMENGAKWAIDEELVKLSLVSHKDNDSSGSDSPARRPFAGARDDNALNRIPGAIFLADVDCSHPIAYGYSRGNLPVFVSGENFLEPSPNRYQTPLVFNDDPLLAGYASKDNLKKLSGSAAVVVETQGSGTVVLFGLDPTFRAYWRGTEKLLLNAMLFGPLMKASDPGAYAD